MGGQISIEAVLTMLGAYAAAVAWLVRLEAKTHTNSKDIQENKEEVKGVKSKQEVMDSKVLEKLSDLQRTVAKIEGRLGVLDE